MVVLSCSLWLSVVYLLQIEYESKEDNDPQLNGPGDDCP